MELELFSCFMDGFLAAKCVFGDFWAFLAKRYLGISKFSKMNIQTLYSSWWHAELAPDTVRPIKSWNKGHPINPRTDGGADIPPEFFPE